MPVFKSFFKILKTKAAVVIIYIGVFLIMMLATVSNGSSKESSIFKTDDLSIAVLDQSRSTLSKQVIKMLKKDNRIEVVKKSGKQDSYKKLFRELNDDVRYGIYDFVLILPEKFAEDSRYNYFASSESSSGYIIRARLDTFLKFVKINISAGMSKNDAMKKAAKVSEKAEHPEISMTSFDDKSRNSNNELYLYYRFMCYSMMLSIVTGICMVFTEMKNEDLVWRIQCSSIPLRRIGLERLLAAILFAISVMGLHILFAFIGSGGSSGDGKLGLLIVNLIPLTLMSAAFAFFLSALTGDENIINMITNMVAIAMSFMCGVFIDQNMLLKSVMKAAHFMPFYWYECGVNAVRSSGSSFPADFVVCIVIQLVFAVAFAATGMVISRVRAFDK